MCKEALRCREILLAALILFLSFDGAHAQKFVLPVGEGFVVTRGFMERRSTSRHTGVDLASAIQPEGDPVVAIADGEVVEMQEETAPTGWGHMLRIRHDILIDGQPFALYSQYAHLEEGSLLVEKGDPVTKGQPIARVDCTGKTEGNVPCANGQTGPHLHFEVKLVPAGLTNPNGCGYIPSSNCPDDLFANYFDPLAFIAGENVYVSSFSEGRIYVVDKKSAAKAPIASGFTSPEDMTVDSSGVLYVGGVFLGAKRFDTGNFTTLPDVGVNICGPEGPSLSSDGHLFVNTRLSPCQHSGIWIVSSGNATIGVQAVPPFSAWGEGTAFLTTGPFAGHLMAADSTGQRVVRIPPTDFGNLFKEPASFIVGICQPIGLAVNSKGDVFVSDPCRQEIRMYGPTGVFKQVFASGLVGPLFMEFDAAQNLYVAHWPSGDVFKFLPNGNRALLVPNGPPWQTNVPESVGVAIRQD